MTRAVLTAGTLTVLLLATSGCSAPDSATIPFRQGWEYRPASKLDIQPPGGQIGQGRGAWRPVPRGPLLTQAAGNHIWLRSPKLPTQGFRDPVLHLSIVNQSFAVFVDRKPIYQFGRLTDGASGYAGWPSHRVRLPEQMADKRIYVRVYSDATTIGLGGAAAIGENAAVISTMIARDVYRLALGAMFIASGLFSLLLFVRNRTRTLVAALGTFSCLCGLYVISNRTVELQYVLLWRPMFWLYVEYFSLFLMPPALGWFFVQVAPSRISRYATYVMLAFAGGAFLVHLAGVPAYRLIFPFFYLALAGSLTLVAILIRDWIRGNPEARIAGVAVLIFLCVAIYDLLGVLGLIAWPQQMLVWGLLGFQAGLAGIVVRRYTQTRQRVQQYARDLETAKERLQEHAALLELRVAERTENLNRSLKDIRSLKEQQDADYFLIWLLMQPLKPVPLRTDQIEVDMAIRQRKAFDFRGQRLEIGGDLCLAESITLRDRPYVVFVNGDAMGKSMQGAGGAIVLGTVFASLLQRLEFSRGDSNRKPETFLRDCFRELNRVFLSFDGGMLTTMLLGIADPDGRVSWINCEHPGLVLMQNGKADFVPGERITSKLGMSASDTTPELNSLRLQAGDTLLVGSDGKDDLLTNATGANRYNEDERLFLSWAERGRGSPDAILKLLEERGGIMDDLSLLSLRFAHSTKNPM